MKLSMRAARFLLPAGAALTAACAGTTGLFLNQGKSMCYDQRLANQCVGLGDNYMGISAFAMASDWSHDVDPRNARRAYATGCELGDARSCGRLLALHLAKDDPALEARARQAIDASPVWSNFEDDLRHDVAMARLTAAKINVSLAERAEREAEEAASKPGAFEVLAGAASTEATYLKGQARMPGIGAKAARDYNQAAKIAGQVSTVASQLDAVIPASRATQATLTRATGMTFPAIPMPPGALTTACDEGCSLAQYLCKNGVLSGCRQIGRYYQQGQGGFPHDVERAARIYDATCAADPHVGCTELGFLYARGEGNVRRDKDRALAAMRRACDAKGALASMACSQAKMLENAAGNAPPMPPALIDDPACQSHTCATMHDDCARGDPMSCSVLASIYQRGSDGVTKQPERAARIYDALCTAGGPQACMTLALMASTGEGVPLDKARAMQVMKSSCDAKLAPACSLVGAWGDAPYASAHLVPLCDAKDAIACSYLVRDTAQRDHAMQRLRAMCDGGDRMACALVDTLQKTLRP